MGEEKAKEAVAAAPADKGKEAEEKKDEGGGGEEKKEDAPPPPPPPPEEVVMRVFMHCEGCARKVKKSLKGFDGVEDVSADSKAHKVVVKGKKAAADPMKVVERVQKKTGRKVELLSPMPPPKEEKKEEEKKEEPEPPKPEEKKEEPTVLAVVLKVHMHCEACAQVIKKRILKMKGVQSVEADLKASQVTVKGVFEEAKLSLLDAIQPAPTLLTLGTTAAARHSSDQPHPASPTTATAVAFPECPADFQDYTPCTDPKRWRRYGNYRLSFMERHCPPPPDRQQCLVPPPKGYKPPIRWPKSKDQCWYRNVPYDWINSQKSNQHWLAKEGDRFRFPGGGTMFPNGVSAYVDLMAALIPGMRDGTVRTALDTGCGVASWGGDLLGRGILTVSLAPRDNHEAQVQFALERGIPAILGIISTQRLPFPSAAFDMAHCSRCLIPWTEFGGLYLLEIHRILRPGGFWVLSGPPINYENRWHGWNTTAQAQKADFDRLKKMLAAMCFKLYNMKGDIAVWQKSPDATACYDKLTPITTPAKCDDSVDPDAAWYVPMRSCVTAPSAKYKKLGLNATPKWPQRLSVAPERINVVPGSSAGAFKHDDARWKLRAKHYKTLLPALGTDKIRNVMDMNTVYGGFAASLIKDPIWVMNVVSSYGPNSLGVVYDRGLIGVNHDWCEAFSTYPRTYDLLHLDGLFTAESHRCEMKFVLLEMDRILRPTGYAIIRESTYFLDSVAAIAKGMRWSCEKRNPENKTDKDKILICQKKLWVGKQ